MKTERNILVAFLLNLAFSIFEFIGGLVTGSVAIVSDSVHDMGDAASIGISFFLERKSKKSPDDVYTYGYVRYSLLGSLITTTILIVGSVGVIVGAVKRIFNPVEINYDGMIGFAIVGVVINFLAAFFTRHGDSLNQKAVNLHMLEDVLGWVVVLVGAVVMRFTDVKIIDSLMSIGVSVFILVEALKGLKEVGDIFLEKIPSGFSRSEIAAEIKQTEGVIDCHHLHLRTIDGEHVYLTAHVVVDGQASKVKADVKKMLKDRGISHSTLELEDKNEVCEETDCHFDCHDEHHGHHHHHHHHHH